MSQTDIVLDLYDSMDADLAKVPTLYSPAQRATQQEIEIAKLQHKIEALQAAQDDIRSRAHVAPLNVPTTRRKKSYQLLNFSFAFRALAGFAAIGSLIIYVLMLLVEAG